MVEDVAALAGTWDGVDALYRDQHASMVRLAHLITGSNDVAQEVVQDAFVKVHAKWPRVREPLSYLRRVVVNECRARHRRRLVR